MINDSNNQGLSSPLKLNSRDGIQEARDDEKIRQSVLVILGTGRGERLMRPNFGSNLKSLLFAPLNASTANLAKFYVEEALSTWEPRIVLEEVTVESNQTKGELIINIRYQIKSTREPGEIIYPFSLQQP